MIFSQISAENNEKERKYKLSVCSVPTQRGVQNAKKKKAKKIKKNPIMASFQAKIVWKRQRKRENKNYKFVPSLPDT